MGLNPHFNTSKVRLEVHHRPARVNRLPLFQYLKGAIGRRDTVSSFCTSVSNFNTSKVRLEGGGYDDHGHGGRFQYLKGAIGSCHAPLPQRDQLGFQYLKGAIGRLGWPKARPIRLQFQYLKGAIGRAPRCTASAGLATFQYLKGAIGRLVALGSAIQPSTYFNTSKVRLEDDHLNGEEGVAAYFNTSKVRLEALAATVPQRAQRISIPQRCDWKPPATW